MTNLVSKRTGKSSNDMSEDLIREEDYGKPEPKKPEPSKASKAAKLAYDISQEITDIVSGGELTTMKRNQERGYKEHR